MRRKALIVTERRELYQEIIESLQNSCLKIDHSATYAQAVNRCSRFHYILMILDIHFSEMNGMAVVRRLRQLERDPILVLSARYSRQEEIEALNAGADAYIVDRIGEVVTKEELLEHVWKENYDICADASLKFQVQELRKKLCFHGATDVIETIWGIGYLLCLEDDDHSPG